MQWYWLFGDIYAVPPQKDGWPGLFTVCHFLGIVYFTIPMDSPGIVQELQRQSATHSLNLYIHPRGLGENKNKKFHHYSIEDGAIFHEYLFMYCTYIACHELTNCFQTIWELITDKSRFLHCLRNFFIHTLPISLSAEVQPKMFTMLDAFLTCPFDKIYLDSCYLLVVLIA